MKKISFLAATIVLYIILLPANIFSQNECPPIKGGPKFSHKTIDTKRTFTSFSLLVQAEFYERKNGDNSYEIILDKSTVSINNKFVSGYTANQMAMMQVALSKAKKGESVEVSFVYPTNCTVNLRTILRVDKEQKVYCCENPEIDPKIYEYNGNLCSDYWSTKTCGTKCCKITYTVNMCDYEEGLYYVPYIAKKTDPESYNGSICNETTQYFDCRTGEPRQCESDCKPAE